MEPEEYQRTMQEQYEATIKYRPDESEIRMRREFYSVDAAAKFKKEFWPADPFETGVLVDAHYLEVSDLAAIYKAAYTLKLQGNEAFVDNLILYKRKQDSTWNPLLRVSPLWIDAARQRKIEICELLEAYYRKEYESFVEKRQEIIDMKDAQLLEYLRQAEEALHLQTSERKMEAIVDEN